MMCGTASVQVCLDARDDSKGQSGYRARWRLLHEIGPVLVAAFANSPLRVGAADRLALGPTASVGEYGPGPHPGSGA